MGAARREREREEARRHAEAREETGVIWKASRPAPSDQPYLVKKGVKPHGLRVHDAALVIPVRGGAELHSLQFIGPEGNKRFLTGGRVANCYFDIGAIKGAAALCVCEGYATRASIYEATKLPGGRRLQRRESGPGGQSHAQTLPRHAADCLRR